MVNFMKTNKLLKVLMLSSSIVLVGCNGSKTSSTSTSIDQTSSSINNESSSIESKDSSTSVSQNSSSTSSANSSSVEEIVSAKAATKTIIIEDEYIPATDLFNIPNNAAYELSTSNIYTVKISQDKKGYIIVHGGDVTLSIKCNNKTASVKVSIMDKENTLNFIATKLSSINTGFNISGFYYQNGNEVDIYKTFNRNYIYDNFAQTGFGVFKDGNVYKFKGTSDGKFVGFGGSLGTAAIWRNNNFKDFTATNKYISKNGNNFYIPYNTIGSENMNPLAKSFLEQVGLSVDTTFQYINLSVGSQGEISITFVTNVFNGKESKAAEYILADFGIAGINDVEAYLATAEIPTVKENSNEALKQAFKKFMNSKSYRIFGADVTDSDHEIFYNYYSPTQYYEYYMDDAYGLINLDGKVYNYTADKNNHVVLGSEVAGLTDYKQKIETLYTVNDSIFDNVTYNNAQDCYIYVPKENNNALASFLLHTCGYDLKGNNYLNNVDEIAFLVDGDNIYVDINMNANMAYGQIKFQFDRIDSVDMPQYIKPTEEEGEGKEYAGYYKGKGTVNVSQGKYEEVTSDLTLKADLTGTFTFGENTYQIAWSAKDDESNQNIVRFTINITSETTKGESFIEVYKYKSSPKSLQVKFSYDSSKAHISWNTYTLQD